MPFTEADALDALRAALRQPATRPEGAYTVRELQEAIGTGERAVRRALGKLLAAGQLEVVRIPLPYLDGRVVATAAYRIVKPAKRKRAA